MTRVWVARDDFAGGVCLSAYLLDQSRSQKAFAIVFENDRVGLIEAVANVFDDPRDLSRGRRVHPLAIDSHHLLVSCDDSSFYNRTESLVLNHVGCIDILRFKKFAQVSAMGIGPNEPDNCNVLREL